jgi:uncharacterized membrane protein
VIRFFKPEEEDRIIRAIKAAEKNTSGEVRVHLEVNCEGELLEAAAKVFHRLKMDRTELRNGVLIFLVPERRQFAIIGDKGINEKVPENFWQEVRNIMQAHFREGDFAQGVCEGITRAGEKLKEFFPYQKDDKNELPDEISYS